MKRIKISAILMSITMLISVTLVYAGETAETVHAEETQTAEIAEAAEIGENDLAADAGEAGDEDNASEAEEIQNTSPGVLLGGWNIAEDTTVTEEQKKVFEKAAKGLTGAAHDPAAYLGYQIVSGRNHCFLCRTTPTVPEPVSYYTLVYIYEDLGGNSEITNIAELDIAALSAGSYAEDTEDTEDVENTEDMEDMKTEEANEADMERSEETEEATPSQGLSLGASLTAAAGTLLGGWETSEDPEITDELAEVFEKASGKLLGVDYAPVAFLSSQVVAGKNYCFLCKVYPGTVPHYALVFIYQNPEGKIEITGMRKLNIAVLSQKAFEDEAPDNEAGSEDGTEEADETYSETAAHVSLAGGWFTAESSEITDEIRDLMDKAFEKPDGAEYEPVAYLGSQVVAGRNHCILCRTTGLYPGALPYYTLVYIYQDLMGNASVTNIVELNIAGLSQPEITE